MANELHAPVWAREDAFPHKPVSGASGVYGFVDRKGNEVSAESIDDLVAKINKTRSSVDLIWTPAQQSLQAPEEVPELRAALWKRRSHWAEGDLENGKRMSLLFGAVMLWYLYAGYRNTNGDLVRMLLSPPLGICGILLLIFGLLPLYEGWKTLRKGKPASEEEWLAEAEESRFDSWLYLQKTPTTYFLIAMMIASGLAQLFLERGLNWSAHSVDRAGLLKQGDVEWWRFLTAPYLHGNLLHWLMNTAAILYLGRRVELLARWPHVIIVMFGSAWVGGIASSHFLAAPTVGASGGIMGLLGFLLVFEAIHKKLVPKSSRRRILAGVIMTVLMGLLGFQFIDNAAHAGGLIAGMGYALIGFPVSKSPRRPAILKQDRWIAFAMAGIILGGLILVFSKLFV
ncbi:MAG: membrane associated rhomboid family serine protease [Cryomorphaceae bacterium]|jgi:membrane associated rhomboid family serine protease